MYLCQTNEYSLLTCTVLFSCITLNVLLQYTLLVKHRVLLTEGIVMQEVVGDKQVTVIWNLKEGVGSLYFFCMWPSATVAFTVVCS